MITSPSTDGDHVAGTITVKASFDAPVNQATLFVNEGDGTYHQRTQYTVSPDSTDVSFSLDTTKRYDATALPSGTQIKIRVNGRDASTLSNVSMPIRTVVTGSQAAITEPADASTVTGTVDVAATFDVLVDRVTLFTKEGTVFVSHGTQIVDPPSRDVTFAWDTAYEADGSTPLADASSVVVRMNGRDANALTNVGTPTITVTTDNPVPVEEPPAQDPELVIWPRDFNDGVLPGSYWPGSQFGVSDTGGGVPAVSLLDPTDPAVPSGAPQSAKKILQLVAGADPVRGGSARAEVSQGLSTPSGGVPPYVDANGVEWPTAEWMSNRVVSDRARQCFYQDGFVGGDRDGVLADSSTPTERWNYYAIALPSDPAVRPASNYILSDRHAKLGVNFVLRIASGNPDALEVVIRGGLFQATPTTAKPDWCKSGPLYTGYNTAYNVLAYDGPTAPQWFKDPTTGAWTRVTDSVSAPSGATVYDRRPGEWPNRAWDYASHKSISVPGIPKNGVPAQFHWQQYQRIFTILNPIPWGTWLFVKHREVWSTNADGGHQMWINGDLVLDAMGVPTLYKWENTLGTGDCKLGYGLDADGTKRQADYLGVYEQFQCYSAGQAPLSPPARAWFAPICLTNKELATEPW